MPARRWRSLTNLRNFERLRAFTLHRITWPGIIYRGREREQARAGRASSARCSRDGEGFRPTVNRPTTAHYFKFSSFPLSAHVAGILTGGERYRVNLLSFRDTRHATISPRQLHGRRSLRVTVAVRFAGSTSVFPRLFRRGSAMLNNSGSNLLESRKKQTI